MPACLASISHSLNACQERWHPFLIREIRAKSAGVHFSFIKCVPRSAGVYLSLEKEKVRDNGILSQHLPLNIV